MKTLFFNKTFFAVSAISLSVAAIGYLGSNYYFLFLRQKALLEKELSETKKELSLAKEEFSSTKEKLENENSALKDELAGTKTENEGLEQRLADEKTRVDMLAMKVSGITDTVGVFEKLKQTDPELLKKYSKVYFLNENYIPSRLSAVDLKYVYDSKKKEQMHEGILKFFQDMMENASTTKIDVKIISAYRSFPQQAGLKSAYTITYGAGTANKFSADQGYSEHQLGTAVDFTTVKLGVNFVGFEKTPAYQWLKENAYKYGFILSYPKSNAYYIYEPWHWRFVGRDLAGKLHEENKNFYDMDQRALDQYILSFFD